jgi:uncharacterized protein (DUF488 family)
MPPQLFTIGHSTHPLDRFLALLAQHHIEVVADIRRFPGSRKHPQFNRDGLATSLPEAGIEYNWLAALGGRRGKKTNGSSNNLGLRNESFRNYADYMHTEEFREGIRELLAVAGGRPTVFMCSESVFWRCHRRLVADYLLVNEVAVRHIMPSGELRLHTLTEGARVEAGALTYPHPDGADQGIVAE